MPVLAVPGPVAPAPPPVTVEVPEAWEALPPGADLLHVHLAVEVDDVVTGATDDGTADAALSRLLLATGRVRGSGLDADYDALQSVLETVVVGGAA